MKTSILIVDDEEYILTGLRDNLASKTSYRVVTASSGARALDILSSEEIDLIIVDINMPEIDGKRILEAVKEIEPDTPVIIITGVHVDEVETLASEWGADDYLTKPIEIDHLLATIRKVLGESA
jgi:DNA-binding response OmpR family regulator